MLRKLTVLVMSFLLCVTTVACTSSSQSSQNAAGENISYNSPPLNDGQYPVQQATYNDVDGTYELMLLNTPAGSPPVYRTENLQLARLTDDQISAGEKTHLKVENGQPVLYLTEDYKIEYVHNVTETQTNPQTGRQETVIVRRESSFWTPFAGAIAGQMVANALFTPRYYVPPVYSGGTLRGYGGYGNTYSGAVKQYQTRYNAPPAAVKNRSTFRATGSLRNTPSRANRNKPSNNSRATGSGYGGSDLKRSNKTRQNRRSSGSFGSGSKSRRRSGSRRRR
ncbi:MAG: hypothetical protein SW833_16490 [Cyanobacteriota bacterium]|nr:hypothetical protein [Cyanobacteriota bacterium]